MPFRRFLFSVLALAACLIMAAAAPAKAQTAPSADEIAAYSGLHAAAAKGDTGEIGRLVQDGADLEARDGNGRTPLIVAAFRQDDAAAKVLIAAGANLNALDNQSYDVITIAAVLNDLDMLKLAIASGGYPRSITSPYGGTALIAAAHLGHAEAVAMLIAAKAPLDHINNLGWTALIEAIVLGDGGERHQATVRALIDGGADLNLPDGKGVSPLSLAKRRGHARIGEMLEQAGARP